MIVKPTGVPATGLSSGVVNPEAVVGILGQKATKYLGVLMGLADPRVDPALLDRDTSQNAVLASEDLVDQILSAIDQPWGVSIGDLTVRATGDRNVL